MLGYTEQELIQHTFANVTHPEDVEMDVQRARQLLQGEIPGFRTEKRYITRSQEVIWGNLTASAIRDQEGKVLYGLGMVENITERKQTVALLQESEEKFRSLLDTAPVAVVIVDDNGRIMIVNVQTEELFGYAREELLGQTVEMLLPKRLRTGHVNHRVNYLIDPRVRPMCPGRDLFGQKKDGSQVPVDVGLSAIKTREGVLVMSFITDITEQKRAEKQIRTALQEKEALLREIHHRVKNNLQTVSSLLSLHAGSTRNEQAREVLRESQNRVKSMAFVHEKLYHSQDLTQVDYAKYIQSLTAYLLHSYGVNPAIINLEVDKGVFLDVDTVIACGLIVNELVSNSLKYAFPTSTESDEIRIALQSNDDDQHTLIVADNGVGFPQNLDFCHTESLGLQLVCALADQLEGAIELYRRDGTEFRITFPA